VIRKDGTLLQIEDPLADKPRSIVEVR